MRPVKLTWMIGGIGLVTCAVMGMLQYAMLGGGFAAAALDVTVEIVFAAAVMLFTIGLSREASVVARRPLGVTALTVVALWPLVSRLAQPLLPTVDGAASDPGLDAFRETQSVLMAAFYVNFFILLGAGVIGALQIARAGTVPGVWRWAPLWAVLASVAGGVIPQLMYVAFGANGVESFVQASTLIGALGFLAQTLGLGILALVLASRVRDVSVEIFRSS